MNLDKLTQRFPKNSWPLILFGIVAGMLGLWIIGKVLKPWIDPLIRTGCRTYLGRLEEESGHIDRVVLVEAQDVELGSVTRRITSVGKLRANAAVMLKAEMAGRIKSIHFSNGDEVQEGDLLIQLEDADLQAELRLSQAELMQKEADFERISRLREQNVESAKRFDEARAALEITRARVERAQAQLDKARIVAPFDGTLGIMDASVGTYLQAGQDLVMLVDNTPIFVDFKVPERYLNEVGAGQQAEIKIDGLPDEVFNATVDAVDASIDPQSHTLAVRASLDNEEGRLRGGQFAHVSLIVGEKPEAMLVPESAIMREGNREFVWVAFQGKAVRAPVVTGTREHTKVEILSGLRPGLSIIFTGQNRLAEGIPVSIQEDPTEAMLSQEETHEDTAGTEAAESEAEPETDTPTSQTQDEPPVQTPASDAHDPAASQDENEAGDSTGADSTDAQEETEPTLPEPQKNAEASVQEAPNAAPQTPASEVTTPTVTIVDQNPRQGANVSTETTPQTGTHLDHPEATPSHFSTGSTDHSEDPNTLTKEQAQPTDAQKDKPSTEAVGQTTNEDTPSTSTLDLNTHPTTRTEHTDTEAPSPSTHAADHAPAPPNLLKED